MTAMLTFSYQEHLPTYYSETRNIDLQFPTLEKSISADICVIGAGFLGLSTAIELAEKGKKVVVIEGARVGFGASGRNGGQAINGFEEGIDKYVEEMGLENVRKLWEMSLEAIKIIDERVNKYQIACDWRKGYATLALNNRRLDDLVAIEKTARELFDYSAMTLWDKNKLQQHLGSEIYCGALYDEQSGHLHPLNYCLGLANAARSLGVEIYEHTPALDLTSDGKQAKITTPKAEITAQNVVLAVNAYIDSEANKKIASTLARKILPVESFIIATQPLDQQTADSLINNGMSVCDNNLLLDYYRLTADNRLLFGSDSSSDVDMVQKMRQNMLKVFPQLENVRIDYGWGGPIDMTLNSAPHFGKLKSNIYFAQGFSGHGVALTGLAGRIIAEAIEGNDERLRLFEHFNVPSVYGGKWIKKMALKIGIPYYRFLDKYR